MPSQSQANESLDSKEQTTSSTTSPLKPTQPSISDSYYEVLPTGETDSPVVPYGQH